MTITDAVNYLTGKEWELQEDRDNVVDPPVFYAKTPSTENETDAITMKVAINVILDAVINHSNNKGFYIKD